MRAGNTVRTRCTGTKSSLRLPLEVPVPRANHAQRGATLQIPITPREQTLQEARRRLTGFWLYRRRESEHARGALALPARHLHAMLVRVPVGGQLPSPSPSTRGARAYAR